MEQPNGAADLPYPNTIQKHVKRLPPEVARWLIELHDHERYPTRNGDGVYALQIIDSDFDCGPLAVVMVTSETWRKLTAPIIEAHHARMEEARKAERMADL